MQRGTLFLMTWEFINQNFIATLIGTFIGVYIAFLINAWQENKKKEHTYGVIADQMAFEWIANSQYAKEIDTTVESGNATVRRFNLKIVESALEQPYIYEFAPREFIKKLRVYRENILIINRLMDYYFSRNIKKEEIEKLKIDIKGIVALIDDLGKTPMR